MSRFDPRLDAQETERTFMWKSSAPYVYFFIVLLITVAVLPLCDKQWIPCSEMSLVALLFTGEHDPVFIVILKYGIYVNSLTNFVQDLGRYVAY